MPLPNTVKLLKAKYLEAVLDADPNRAEKVIAEALKSGKGATAIYSQIICPAQYRMRQMSESGETSVSRDVMSQISLRAMTAVRQETPAKEPLGIKALVTVLPYDGYSVAARIMADLLEFDGWEVALPDSESSVDKIVQMCKSQSAQLLALLITDDVHFDTVSQIASRLKAEGSSTKVLIAGRAVLENRRGADALGVDAVCADPAQSLTSARKLANLSARGGSLEDLLSVIGKRISQRRKVLGLNQEQLSLRAGLDRAYISSVENGKQNVSVGVIFKLAEALDIPLAELLDLKSALGGSESLNGKNGKPHRDELSTFE